MIIKLIFLGRKFLNLYINYIRFALRDKNNKSYYYYNKAFAGKRYYIYALSYKYK